MRGTKKNILKRILIIIMCAAFMFTSVYVPQVDAYAITRIEVSSQLNSLINQYSGSIGNSSVWYAGTQCKGFANWVFLKIFGVYIGAYPKDANYKISNARANLVGMLSPGGLNASTAKELLQKASPGDYLQAQKVTASGRGPHSMIVVSVDSGGINVFDCNYVDRRKVENKIGTHYFSWSLFDSSYRACSLYHAWNYTNGGSSNGNSSSDQVYDPDAGLSDSYAGNYYVNTAKYDLYLRSAQSTNSTILANIPKGTQVYVEKGNSSWAKVTYNGKTGYCSMQYLAKVQEQSLPGTSIRYWLSKSEMGSAVSDSDVKNGDMIYFCYELKRQDNGNLVDVGNYEVKQTVYYPNGKSDSCTYNNNNNWYGISIEQGGNYKFTLDLTGDWTGSYTLTLNNIPSLDSISSSSWFSTTDMGSETHSLEKGKQYYFCFKVTTNEGKYFNDATNKSSVTNINVKASDGTFVINASKNNIDRYSVRFTASKTGRYTSSYTFKADDFSQLSGSGYADCKDTSKKMTKLSVTSKPNKLVYTVGEELDTAGLTITAIYSDGSTKTVTDQCSLYYSTKKAATVQVTASYTEGDVTRSTSFYITVKEKESPQITISYNLNGGKATLGGMSYVSKKIKRGSSYTIPGEEVTKNATITFDSNGGNETPDNLEVKMTLRKWEYYDAYYKQKMDARSGNMITLRADTTFEAVYAGRVYYRNIPVVTRDGYTFDGWYYKDNKVDWYLVDGDMNVTAHWTKNAEKKAASLSKISVTRKPDKLTYYIGDLIDNTGLELTATYSDGTSKVVSGYQYYCDTSKAGDATVTVTYMENNVSKSTQFAVKVINKSTDELHEQSNQKDDSNTSGNEQGNGNDSNSDEQNTSDDMFDVSTEEDSEEDDDSDTIEVGDELSTDDATYTVTSLGDAKTVEYTECESDTKKVVIPATITIDGVTYSVTSIADRAFYKNTKLTAVSIGKNVTSIGSKTFYGCSKLKQIVVNSTKIASIGKNAFKKVPKTVKVLLPKLKYTSYKKMLKKAGISVKAKFKKIK